ncbi:MAG: NfeD family protein [Lachnospiraceae bacterium]|nr:NfeD family protein [Lachnospiraceae bacterium]
MNTSWLVIWLIMLIIFVVIELITTGITSVWMAVAAGVAAVCAAMNVPVWLQFVIFAGVSFLLFAFVRPRVKRGYDLKKRRNREQTLVGERGLVISEVDNLKRIGLVRVRGREWNARCHENGVVLTEGTVVRITEVFEDIVVVRPDDSIVNMDVRDSEARLDPDRF